MSTEFVEDIGKPGDSAQVNEKIQKIKSIESNAEMEDYISKFLDVSDNAKAEDNKEKLMSLKEGIKAFPKAAMWSVILSSVLIMEGYDTNLLSSFYGQPAFAKKFGEFFEDVGEYQIPAKWQTSLSMCVYVGEVLGLFAAGIINDKIGYRKTLIGALMLTTVFIFIVFFAQSAGMLLAGELLLGLPWGVFQTLPVSYASEVCPMVLRIYLTTYVNLCWLFGQLISSGVLRGFSGDSSKWAYKIPFAIQWVWPIPIMIGIYLAPESPWWLVKTGRIEEAKESLLRLLSETHGSDVKNTMIGMTLDKMKLTIQQEERNESETASYFECFKGTSFRRTRSTALVWLSQNLTGTSLRKYSTYFFIQAGLSTDMSFTFSIVQYVLGIVGTLSSWFLEKKVGHFTLYFYGLCGMFTILMLVGGLGCSSGENISWAIGSLLLVFTLVYDLSLGPMVYCLVTEIPSVRLRCKTIILARCTYSIAGIIIAIITPYMLNPTAWNWQAKSAFLWGGFAFLAMVWSYFELPETKGRTFAELDALYESHTKARHFKHILPELFNVEDLIKKMGDDKIKDFVGQGKNETV